MAKHKLLFDLAKCKKDGMCVAVCGAHVLENGEDGYPRLAANHEAGCISCGHCVAVCPERAVWLEGMPAGEDFANELTLTPEQVKELFTRRRSVRRWSERGVDRETVGKLLEVVRWAPTGINRQGVHWLVITSKEEVRKLAGLVAEHFRKVSGAGAPVVAAWDRGVDRVLRDAPGLVIAYGADGANPPLADCLIALTHVDIAAGAFGLGTCWAGYFMAAANGSAEVRAALKLPAGMKMFGALMVGYPKYRMRRAPGREGVKVVWR